MRVAINAVGLNIGGGKTYIINLLDALAGLPGAENHFVAFVRPQLRSLLRMSSPDLTYHEVSAPVCRSLALRLIWEQLALPILLRRYEVGVLYSPGNIGCWAAPVPSVLAVQYTSVFDYVLPEFLSFRRLKWAFQAAATRLSVRSASRIIVVSEWSRYRLSEVLGFPAERADVIYHGLNPAFCPQPEEARRAALARYQLSRPYVLAVSNLMPHKNYPNLLRAFARLTRYPDISGEMSLVVVGGGSDRRTRKEMEQVIKEGSLGERVRLLGGVPYGDLPALYCSAEAFVFPTRSSETFGLPLLEAMGCEVPIAASRASAIPEICGDAAHYFDPDDPEGMAGCIHEVLTSPQLADRLRRRGKDRARSFSWDDTAAQTLAVLLQAASRGWTRQ